MNEETKVPKGALRFVDHGCHAHVEFAEGDEKQIPKLKMVAYAGGIIKDHWYWDNLAIDLDGIQFKQGSFPVLENHDTSRKIAVIGKPIIEDGKLVAPENAKFLSTEESKEFQKLSAEGFPYQSSIYAKPSNVERLEDGATAKVNGFTMKGPGSIWRQCEFKEMSVCVFGWDSNTKASAFSREETEDVDYLESKTPAEAGNIKQKKEVTKVMNKEELMEKHSDLIKELLEEAVGAVETKLTAERDALQTKLTAEEAKNATMADRVVALEKNDVIRRENEFKSTADSIWSRQLADSNIPIHLHEKVSGMIQYSKFVKDDKFDRDGFAGAVTAEIKDWEDKGVTQTAIGSGFSDKEVDSQSSKENVKMEENKSVAARLVERSGLKVKKD